MKYIIEVTNSNPKILEESNGVYSVIGFAAGENNLETVKDLVMYANLYLNDHPNLYKFN